MKTCMLLTARRSLRRRLPLRACRWGLAAALSLLAVLTVWSDRAAAQSTSSAATGAASGQQSSAGNAAGNAGTKINLGSLMGQQIWGADLMGTDVHLKELLQSQSETPQPRNSSAGGAPSETVRHAAQRRSRPSDEELADAADADSGSAQDVPPELEGVQKPPFGNSMFSGEKH
jgi:hypothetical protein